jgi:hypothetical protein
MNNLSSGGTCGLVERRRRQGRPSRQILGLGTMFPEKDGDVEETRRYLGAFQKYAPD